MYFETLVNKQGRKCRICRATEFLEINHIIPRHAGGLDELDNLEILCSTCNKREYYDTVSKSIKIYYLLKKLID